MNGYKKYGKNPTINLLELIPFKMKPVYFSVLLILLLSCNTFTTNKITPFLKVSGDNRFLVTANDLLAFKSSLRDLSSGRSSF